MHVDSTDRTLNVNGLRSVAFLSVKFPAVLRVVTWVDEHICSVVS